MVLGPWFAVLQTQPVTLQAFTPGPHSSEKGLKGALVMKPLRYRLQPPVTVRGQAHLPLQGQGGHALNRALTTTYLPSLLSSNVCPHLPSTRKEKGVNFTR